MALGAIEDCAPLAESGLVRLVKAVAAGTVFGLLNASAEFTVKLVGRMDATSGVRGSCVGTHKPTGAEYTGTWLLTVCAAFCAIMRA